MATPEGRPHKTTAKIKIIIKKPGKIPTSLLPCLSSASNCKHCLTSSLLLLVRAGASIRRAPSPLPAGAEARAGAGAEAANLEPRGPALPRGGRA
nr:unnamed protein product [Digitaria exilis]